jgi:hypothetical protein
VLLFLSLSVVVIIAQYDSYHSDNFELQDMDMDMGDFYSGHKGYGHGGGIFKRKNQVLLFKLNNNRELIC